MQSLGAKLRLERERQKIGIQKIAEDTCISLRYLEAIEADDQSSLPGEFFYRAFVRQYSKYLGWNPDEVEKQINLVSSLPNTEPLDPVAAPSSSLNLSTGEVQISALRETLKDKPMRPAQDDGMSRSWLAFAVLVILACGAYFGWRNFSPAPVQTASASPESSVVQPPVSQPVPTEAIPEQSKPAEKQSAPSESPTADQASAPMTPPAVEKPKEAPVSAVATTPAAGKFALTVRAREMTWIRFMADGARVYYGVLDPGQERSVNAASAELLVGNAGTLDVIYNGKPISYGVRGEVKTLLVSPDGWKLKPKPVPESGTGTPNSSTTGQAAIGGTAPRAL